MQRGGDVAHPASAGSIAGDVGFHAYRWTPTDGLRDLGTLGGSTSTAFAIIDQGTVLGLSTKPATSGYHAFIWTDAGGYSGPVFEFSGFLAPVAGRDESGQYALNRARERDPGEIRARRRLRNGGAGGRLSRVDGDPVRCRGDGDRGDGDVTAGASGLAYDERAGTYTYVWKTDASWTGCRQLVLRFVDGSSHAASFRFDR